MRMIALSLLILALVFVATALAAGEPARATMHHRVEVKVEYPQVGNEVVDDMIRVWLEEHVSEIMAAFSGVSVHPDMEDEDSSDSIAVDYAVENASPRATSFVFETFVFPYKAAHPSGRTDVLNFDMESGSWLTFTDVFDEPDKALAIMSTGAKKKIGDYLRGLDEVQFAEGLVDEDEDWFTGGTEPTPENYAAFALVPEGVKVIFQQYQVLPYVFGMPQAIYTLEELEAAEPNLALWGKDVMVAVDSQ